MGDSNSGPPQGIAIVGMAARFPGMAGLDHFWANLRDGVETVTFFSDQELLGAGVDPRHLADPRYVKARGVVAGVELFDPAFFGFTPREAELMDPQHRVLLECAWEALEDAGYDSAHHPGRIGVYAGSGASAYLLSNLLPNPELLEKFGAFQATVLNDRDFLATRLSYKLDLKGPSALLQTACSTSLMAAHVACQSLLAGECDVALAGGVSIAVPVVEGYFYQEGSVVSPDGHCRAFDARAAGAVGGSGAGIVVLKRLAEALADGDAIRAVIRGSAANNDGAAKVGFTAPSVGGQAQVIAESLLLADVPPDTVAYVEAHGSGTPLGDPIEIEALTQAFRAGTERTGFCAVGSVKTNVGHLNAAAGVAGLIKTVLALEHGTIPPSLHFERPNPQIDFARSPFFVPTSALPWPAGETPRRAGVSSFGLGGTNVHVVLEQAPPPEPDAGPSRSWQLLTLAARTADALDAATARLADHLEARPDLELADAAYTLQVGRRAFEHRRTVVCRDRDDAVAALRGLDPARVAAGTAGEEERPVVFVFPGLGDHYPGMARELYEAEPAFRADVDRSAELLRPHLGLDVREPLFAAGTEGASGSGPGRETDLRALLRRGGPAAGAAGPLAATALAQPALFVVEHALARLLMEWGIRPQAMIGYSLGEYVAACLAGVLPLADALALVARRARLIQELPAGSMLAVPLPEEEVLPLLDERLSLAAANGPHLAVAAGPEEAIAELEGRLAARGVSCLRLATTHAFHSRMMEPAAEPLTELARSFATRAPRIPYVSNVTGTWVTPADLADPGYWARHMCRPVRFAEGIAELLRAPERAFLEVGPGSTLTALARQHPAAPPGLLALAPMRRASEAGSDVALLLEAAGRLWAAGGALDADGLFAGRRRRRVPLPTYPFERRRCWVDPPARGTAAQERPTAVTDDRKAPLADWFYLPGWRQSAPPAELDLAGGGEAWLILSDGSAFAAEAARHLRASGREVVAVVPGAPGSGLVLHAGVEPWTLEPARREGYGALVRELLATGRLPRRVLHLWALGFPAPGTVAPPNGAGEEGQAAERLRRELEPGLLSLVLLAQALSEAGVREPVGITVAATGIQQVADGEPVVPARAALPAALKVLAQEYPVLTCRSVDLAAADLARGPERLARRLLAEAAAPGPGGAVALRGRLRWVRSYEPARLEAGEGLRDGGAYLLSDGTHGLGPALAEALLRRHHARIALLLPAGFPERPDWEGRAAAGDDETARAVLRLLALEASGEVWTAPADLLDRDAVAAALAGARARFGRLDGVFHTVSSAAGGLVQLKTPETVAAALAPQVEGARTLRSLLSTGAEGAPAPFLALCSSTLAVTGGFGQLDIAVCGAFLDALAEEAGDGPPVLALHWDPYQWDGWLAAGLGQVAGLSQAEVEKDLATVSQPAIRSVEALSRALASGLPRLAVSARDLDSVIRQADALTADEFMAQIERARSAEPVHPRQLATPYVEPRNEIEARIVEAWQELFGIDRVGVDDNFLELGGHSLLAIQMVTELRSRFAVDLPITALFEAPTPAALAAAIEAARREQEKPEDPDDMDELLRMVEGLSPEEALQRMQEMGAA